MKIHKMTQQIEEKLEQELNIEAANRKQTNKAILELLG